MTETDFSDLAAPAAPPRSRVSTSVHGSVYIDRRAPGKTFTVEGVVKKTTFTVQVPETVDASAFADALIQFLVDQT